MKTIQDILRGVMIGLANIIPGVSGGTMMVSMGIYDKLIYSVTHLFHQPVKSIKTLLPYFVGMAIGIVGLVSGKYQGMTSAAAIGIVAKREDQFGKAMLFPAMVETYAILALLTSVLVITNVPV